MTTLRPGRSTSAATAAMLVMLAATPALGDVRTEARRHFRRGMDLVAAGQLEEGIAELELAYETLPHPNVLYNIGRAYAEAGRYEDAIEYFERYVESDPPDRAEVQTFLSALQARIAARRGGATPQAAEVVPDEDAAEPEGFSATADEITALEESATQIAALAEATQSDSLRDRAMRLRALAAQLRGASRPSTGEGAAGGTTPSGEEPALALGSRTGGDEDIYGERVVSASRFAQSPLDAPNATYIITRQDIRLSGTTNIGELLRRVPGADVMTMTPADTSVSFRGFNQRLSPRTLVLVDGRSVYVDPLGATFWEILPFSVQDIERIEVIRGPASALYGADAFSGIVNIITRTPGAQGERSNVTLAGGNAGRVHTHTSTSGRVGRFAYRTAGGYKRQNSFSREVTRDRVDQDLVWDQENLGYETVHVNTGASYRLAPAAELTFQAGLNQNRQRFQGTSRLREVFAQGPATHIIGGLNTSWGSIRAFWNRIGVFTGVPAAPVGGDPVFSRFTWNTYDVEAEFAREFHFLVDHNLHIGAGYRRKQIEWTYLSDEQFENHFNVFFQDTMTILDRLILVASGRIDFHPLLSSPVFSPRGAIVVRPTAGSAIRASVGTAFRTQTFLESYLQLPLSTPVAGAQVVSLGSEPAADLLGSPRLTPERIVSAELGYRNADSDLFDFGISAYYNRVTDLVLIGQVRPLSLREQGRFPAGFDEGTGRFTLGTIGFQNDPTVYDVVGGELETRIYPVRGLDVYANYAYNRIFVSESQLQETEDRTSRHKINFGAQYRTSFGLDLSADFHWVSRQIWLEQDVDAERGVIFVELPVSGYYLLNARVGYRLLNDALELGVSAFNITNNRIRQHPFGQRLETRVLGSVSYTF
ncbi:MAG: TonB-dependent receptor [Myxococcales bacterium]|nr:TonB-dependent receptor [Myxococcales bacterium]